MDSAKKEQKEQLEKSLNHPKFRSVGEFLVEFGGVIKLLLGKQKSLRKMDPAFRENICLAVTYANNCSV